MSERFDDLADRLDAIAEEIAEAAIDELRGALQRGEAKRPTLEKRLTQSRRAVEKASHLLRRLDGESADNDD
ncbi:MAG: hypothetical protein ABIR32_04860 [Ilumatobacteraceae bacterium]